jgi:hypothetical protein
MSNNNQSRFKTAWLYCPVTDLGIVFVPVLFALVLLLIPSQSDRVFEQGIGSWASQFVLGNSTHVVLTFLLLSVRRDVLHATKRHAITVTLGSFLVLLATFFGFWAIDKYLHRFYSDLALAALLTFAMHHTLSQVKGLWSLYQLRAKTIHLPKPSNIERRLQYFFVPLGLGLIMTKWIYVPMIHDQNYAFVPGMLPQLPYFTTHFLLAAWALFCATLIFQLLRTKTINASKLAYLSVHCSVVAVAIMWPMWGLIMSAGIHGLEYYFLVGRMLQPLETLENRPKEKLSKAWVWPIMILSMLPLFAIGLPRAPFAAHWFEHGRIFEGDRFLLNAIVVSHYFADAFIYRFRVPEIRKVALARLRFE